MGRSLRLAGEPEFRSGKAPLSRLPLTLPSLSPSALERKRSVGCSGQAPKQAADPRLPPRLEFPDASFIFPNLNTRRPRVVHPRPPPPPTPHRPDVVFSVASSLLDKGELALPLTLELLRPPASLSIQPALA